MIKVLYDHQAFSMQRYGGISRYFVNLHQHFNSNNNIQSVLGVKYSKNYYIQPYLSIKNKIVTKLISSNKGAGYNKEYDINLLEKNEFDIFHPTYYDPYFIDKIKKPFVITVHDMIHEIFREYFPTDDNVTANKKILFDKASHIIAISNSTKKDLQHYFNVPDDKITTVYHGYNMFENNGAIKLTLPHTNYILFVGAREKYKNFNRFVEGIAPILDKNKEIKLVCAGDGKFTKEELELLKKHRIEDRSIQLIVSDAALVSLYQNAMAFIFPSLYEGFGFPILEAFNAGCPALVSNTSCFKEVGGDAALYFDPNNANEITHAINRVIHDSKLAKEQIEKGKLQLKKFTIEKCVEATKNVYTKML